MNVRWSAVFIGWLVDFVISLLLQLILSWTGFAGFFSQPDPTRPIHLLFLLLFLLSTGVGGFVAAYLAGESFTIHGLLVGVTVILANMVLNPGIVAVPPIFVLHQAAGCALAALTGFLAGRLRRPD